MFARSNAWTLGFGLVVVATAFLIMLITPLVTAVLIASAQEAWTADNFIKALFFGFFALVLAIIIDTAGYFLPWLMLRRAWQRRRWPLAVLGRDSLWIDGHDLAWHTIGDVNIVQMRIATVFAIDTTAGAVNVQLFPLAEGATALHDAIRERLIAGG
jgi:hypothetical protein